MNCDWVRLWREFNEICGKQHSVFLKEVEEGIKQENYRKKAPINFDIDMEKTQTIDMNVMSGEQATNRRHRLEVGKGTENSHKRIDLFQAPQNDQSLTLDARRPLCRKEAFGRTASVKFAKREL
jgi:hypothetical protein